MFKSESKVIVSGPVDVNSDNMMILCILLTIEMHFYKFVVLLDFVCT